MTFKVTEN